MLTTALADDPDAVDAETWRDAFFSVTQELDASLGGLHRKILLRVLVERFMPRQSQ